MRTHQSDMIEQVLRKHLAIGCIFLGALVAAYVAWKRPFYVTDPKILGGLILLEFVIAAVWLYRRVFLAVLLVGFLLAGTSTSMQGVWISARWLLLIVGALIGCVLVLTKHWLTFGLFHAVAILALLASLVSATVSQYPHTALLKTSSIVLLFAYASTGARIAYARSERNFFAGLRAGSEILVVLIAGSYALGMQILGNQNSLGAVMCFLAPVLLWSLLFDSAGHFRPLHIVVFSVCLMLLVYSQARAAMLAAASSCGLLCLILRQYKLFILGTVTLIVLTTGVSIVRPEIVDSLWTSIVFKGHEDKGFWNSRYSSWDRARTNIEDHPWFGMGIGTTIESLHPQEQKDIFASSGNVTAENGSSYLSLLSGVGVVGTIPFSLLLLILLVNIHRTMIWTWRSRSRCHPALPIAIVLVSGIIHAIFEDWMFAAGNYLCVWFWVVAFIFLDVAPRTSVQMTKGSLPEVTNRAKWFRTRKAAPA